MPKAEYKQETEGAKPGLTKVQCQISKDAHKKLRVICAIREISLDQYVGDALNAALAKEGPITFNG